MVGLSGPLGSGKTTFIKAVVQARLGTDLTSSPTFTFWHRYASTGSAQAQAKDQTPIDHLDLYRIEDPRELSELGLDEAFDGTSIVMVEWWLNAPGLLPPVHYEVAIEGKGEGPRRVMVLRRAMGDNA